MEFGDPPLYAEINRTMRDWDLRYLNSLGPYAACLSYPSHYAENKRLPGDSITTGQDIEKTMGGVEYNLGGIYLLFRGVRMKKEWIDPYEQNITFKHPRHTKADGFATGLPYLVNLRGYTSCSLELEVAFSFAFQGQEETEYLPTIFIFSAYNNNGSPGIRLNSEAYTAYPHEGEIVLGEGRPIWILQIQRDHLIQNEHPGFSSYNGKKVTLIHVFIS